MSLKRNIFILTFCVFLKCVIADRNQDKTDVASVNPIVLHTSISKASPFNGLSIISRNLHTSYEERQRPEQLLSVQQSNFWPAKTSKLFFEERYQPETRIEQKFPINIEEYNEKNSHDRYQHLGYLQLYNILPSYENSKFSAELLTDGDLLHYRSQPSNRKPPDRGPPPRPLTSWDEYPTRDALIDREQQHQQQKYYSYITSEPQNSPSSVSPLPNISPSSNTNNNNNVNHTEETVSSLYKSGMKKTSNSSRKNYQVLFQAQPVVPEE